MAERFPIESTGENRGNADRAETPAGAGRPWWFIYLPIAMLSCALLAIGFMVIFVVAGSHFPESSGPGTGQTGTTVTTEQGQDPTNRQQPTSTKTNESESDTDTAAIEALRAKEERSLRLAKLERFTSPRDQLQRDLQHVAAEMTSWESFTKDLLDEDAGRHIASDPTYIEHFLPVYEKEHVGQEEYESFQRRVAQLSEPIAIAEKENSEYMPSEGLLTEIKTLRSEISAAIRTLEGKRKDAEAIQRFAANRPPAEITLRSAIDQFRTQQRKERIDQVAAARRKEQEETTARLSEEATKLDRSRRDVDLARMATENAKLQGTKRQLGAKAAAAAKERELAAKEAQLRREFEQDRSKVESLLRPFISHGMTQPKGRQFIMADEEGPVSLARLRSTGALEPTAEGREILYWITSANKMNDRDLGGFPDQGLGASAKQRNLAIVKQAQELLIKYGDLMVKDGMLAK